ncbi:MAG: hypothetical protein JSV34_06390, partial [Candidatus Omnitrophota bacterium]
MEQEFKLLEEDFQRDYQAAVTLQDVEALRVKYLGRKSVLAQLFSRIPQLQGDEKGRWGRQLNSLKVKISSLLEEKVKSVGEKEETFDLTFPSYP